MSLKNIIYLTVFSLVIGSFISCKCAAPTPTEKSMKLANFIEISKGAHSNIEESKYMIINDKKTYNEVFLKINQTRVPKIDIQNIDFENNQIIALFMGMKSSGGYAIAIDHILCKTDELTVYIKENKPNGPATSVLTQPYFIAQIPKTDKKINFVKLVD
jgi:hypothetical protein